MREREWQGLAYCRDEFGDARQAMVAAYATGDYSLLAIADWFGVHYSLQDPTPVSCDQAVASEIDRNFLHWL